MNDSGVWKAIGIGCLGIFMVGALLFAGLLWFLLNSWPTLDATLDVPAEVALSEEFDMVVTMSNPHPDEVVLDSIDIGLNFLDGFQVESITPEPVDTYSIFIMRTYEFNAPVQPGDELQVVFRLRAVQPGHFSGDLDVCNPTQDFVTLVPDVVVRENGASPAG